ncbi:nuclear hormone receptor HR96 isoform X1 [Spodoptera litura]|uniref:Nuclear hormone receptor HR96 isoform X1 n=1 Tax=Spodoptera litura TaxID=69820 RepID=A0A9J7IWE9_SPOLT|nr:nuclear hormone receptor HR96 isoform X1 [Spodoptera litura]
MDNNSDKKDDASAQKKEVLSSLQKICLVCGDKALGYNFNAISCESCKAFFRRNALASKEFKCPFTNNCVITVVTRRFCQKCRLEKCLSIGMVKEFIMSEEDKAEKRRKIEENRARKRQRDPDDAVTSSKNLKRDDEGDTGLIPLQDTVIQYDTLSTTCSPSSTVQSPLASDLEASLHSPLYNYTPAPPVPTNEQPYPMKVYPIDEKSIINRGIYDQRMMDSYNMYENVDSNNIYPVEPPKQNSIRSILTNSDKPAPREARPQHICEEIPSTSNNPDINKARDILQDVERIEPNSMESILCEAIKLEFEAYTSVSPCSGSSRELNEVERAKLNELIVANKALHAPIDDDVTQLVGETASSAGFKGGDGKHDPRLITIVNLTAVAIRRFIKMAKKINAFKNMCEEDQVALLKGGCIEMMVLRSTMTYDGQRKQWKIPHCQEQFGSIRTDVLKLAKGNIYRSHDSFIRSFEARWRTDEHVILIMSAILLFTPDRPKVVHPDVIKLEQNSYYYLLRRYLESVYPGCEAKSTFLKLIQKILELRKLAEEVTGVYLDVNPIEPLLMEIFDLKHHAA